jgi:hypothetical protein
MSETVVLTRQGWSDEFLDSMRLQADPLADRIINEVFADGPESARHASALFRRLIRNRDPVPPDLPAGMRQFFEDTAQLPDWADPEMIREGEELFIEFGPTMLMMLFYKSLPEAYSCWRGAEVLLRTGRMTEHNGSTAALARRLGETTQFVLDVMAPGGLSAGGTGIRSIQKVRLLHATIRHFIRESAWDRDVLGEPINQEDMAGTLMSFSYALLEGLALLGIEVSRSRQEAYLHCWKVVGHILGLRDEVMPDDVDDARALTESILHRHVGPSEAGQALTTALIDFVRLRARSSVLRGMPSYMILYFTSDRIASALGVHAQHNRVDDIVLSMCRFTGRWIDRVSDHRPIVRKMVRNISYAAMRDFTRAFNHEKQAYFEIPSALRSEWGMASSNSVDGRKVTSA